MLYGYDSDEIIPCCHTTDNNDDNQVKWATARFFLTVLLSFFIIFGCKNDKETKEESGLPVKWSVQLPAAVYYGSPALSHDENTLYLGTSTPLSPLPGNHFFVALNTTTGQEIWRLPLESNEFRSAPVVHTDHSLFFTVETRDPSNGNITGDELWHVSQQGEVLWKYEINSLKLRIDVGLSVPAIGADGILYFGQEFGRLYAINASDGTMASINNVSTAIIWSSPVIDKNGVLYINDMSGRVYALQTTGKGLKNSAQWPKYRNNNQNTGCVNLPKSQQQNHLYSKEI